ncbi:hypothetical protein BpHYR1_033332 [Brachionus plicatilis]|uniref:Uncharacterized protein n=1 Tax=Brachionus plicatilis TaxID=10195 RepID=A0A3M7QKS3_BRAPC|nr:hypothetical protein BpHYR1_033332 [Brachionus plicatilis]
MTKPDSQKTEGPDFVLIGAPLLSLLFLLSKWLYKKKRLTIYIKLFANNGFNRLIYKAIRYNFFIKFSHTTNQSSMDSLRTSLDSANCRHLTLIPTAGCLFLKPRVYVRPCTKYPTYGIKACVANQGDTDLRKIYKKNIKFGFHLGSFVAIIEVLKRIIN